MRLEERFMRYVALLAGYALLLQAILTAVEIVSRKLFNHSLQGVDELGGYVLAISASVGFGYAVVTHAHTRVDFALKHATMALRSVLHLLASLVLLVVSSGMLWFAVRSLRASIRLGSTATTPLQTPLWIPQGVWVFGMVMFVLVSLVTLLRCVARLRHGDHEGVEALLQAQSSEQQELLSAGFEGEAQGRTD
ncbi:TRAP transporter small permease subunit [Granulosicoccus sp. 3-233]|uniref:TRAP transporter small permease subunit n=1 Tax=Granulosicoccus sp. 3-233 TaxID=3417969 RepID=UPI003D34A0C8